MGVLVIAALAYAVHLISYAEKLSIQTVRVSGAEQIDVSTVEAHVRDNLQSNTFRYFSPRNIFAYSKDVLEGSIVESFPRIRSAAISRESLFSQTLEVAIEERDPYALWCAAEADCYALDDTGFVFATSATTSRNEFETPYVFIGGIEGAPIGKHFIPEHFSSVLALLTILQQSTGLVPARADVLPEQDLNIVLQEGFYLKVSLGQVPETIARNLSLVLSSDALRDRRSEIEYIDLRFGNRVYYKMKGEEQANI